MALRFLVATLVGTVLAFAWGALSWSSGMYDFAFRPMAGGADAAARIVAGAEQDAAYIHPSPPELRGLSGQQAAIAQQAYEEEHRRGPLVMALVRREGVDASGPTVLVRGFLVELFATSLLAAVMGLACRAKSKLRERVALALLVPAFAMVATHGVLWNFLHLPAEFSMALFLDGFVAWVLAGLPCAFVIRPVKA